MSTRPPGFWRCLSREWSVLRKPGEQAALLWIPIAAMLIGWAVFSRGVAQDLPVAVRDEDLSAASRQFIRWLDATSGLRVTLRPESTEAGWSALRRGEVYGVVLIPRDFARDLKLRRSVELQAWYNAQFLTVASTVSRDMQAAAIGFGATIEARGRLARGETREIASVRLNPIGSQRTTLFNPEMNYGPFLVTAIVIAVLHMAAMLAAVRAVGRELLDGTAPEWLASAGGSRVTALSGKLAVPFVLHVAIGCAVLILWHGVLGWPLRGSGILLTLGLVVLIAAYYALGAAFVLVTSNYRLASGSAAFFTAPALAFGGITFPLDAMPWPAWAWGKFLPLTSYLQLQVEQTVRGAPVLASMPGLLTLIAFAVTGAIISVSLLTRRAQSPSAWGKR